MSSPTSDRHHEIAAGRGPIAIGLVTVSDSRTPSTDTNGRYLQEQVGEAGHQIAGYRLISDEPEQIGACLEEMAAGDARLIIFNGGTGISPRDTTFDILNRAIERPIPGFGELFRMLSYHQVGAAAMLSRATAGVYRKKVVFSLPGSPAAVRLAWEELIAPEIEHLAWQVAR